MHGTSSSDSVGDMEAVIVGIGVVVGADDEVGTWLGMGLLLGLGVAVGEALGDLVGARDGY